MATASPIPFGQLLRQFRKAAGLTQETLAQRAGVAVRTISDLEREVSALPHPDTVTRLATSLKLGPSARAAFVGAAQRRRYDHTAGQTMPPNVALARMDESVSHARVGVITTELIGRSHELALIDHHLHAYDAPPLLLLAGEPGMGKSRLLEETAWRARVAGWRVMRGECARTSVRRPFAPLIEALARSLSGVPLPRQRSELHGCAWLARLLPELLESEALKAPSATLPPAQERRLMFASVRRYLENAASAAGTLLVLDDLQWAGADAVELLASLVRASTPPDSEALNSPAQIRIIGAYRDTEVRTHDLLGETLIDLSREGQATRTSLGQLSVEEAMCVFDGALRSAGIGIELSPEARDRLVRRAGGVPFNLVHLALDLRNRTRSFAPVAALSAESSSQDDLPQPVVETIRQRTVRLPIATCNLLDVAAIIGRTVSFPLLAAALGRSEHETLGALDAALYERLLVEEAPRGVSEGSRTGTTYRFTHDLIHEAILHDLSAARRMTLHRAVGEALERAPEERRQRYVSDLAHHFVEAHEPEPGLRYTLLSGRHAESVYAYAEAEQRYLTALALARELGDQEAEGVALERLSAAMRHGQRAEALALILEQALERHVSPDALERRRWIVAQLGQTYAETGAVDTGKERLISLLPSLETGAPSANLAAVYVALAYLYRSAEQHAEQLDVARKGAALARATHDDPTLTDALFWEGTALFRLGHAEQATEALEVALRLSKASGDPWMLSLALNKAAMPYSALGDFSRAREYTQQALEIAESAGIHGLVYNRLGELAGLAYTIGDWHLALTYMERKDRLHQDQMASHVVGWIYPNHLAFRGELRLATGRVDLAEADLREAIARSVHNRNADLSARCVLAQRDLLAGQPEAARAWVAGYLTRDDASPLDPHIDANTLDLQWVLVWTLTETGETRRAQMLADQALDKATGWRYPVTQVDALWACAFVALRMADWDTASSRLDEALALCRVLPYPHAEARCLYLYGQLHASQCDARRACECLDAALTICLRLGERFYSTVIERELQSQRELLAQGGRVRLRF